MGLLACCRSCQQHSCRDRVHAKGLPSTWYWGDAISADCLNRSTSHPRWFLYASRSMFEPSCRHARRATREQCRRPEAHQRAVFYQAYDARDEASIIRRLSMLPLRRRDQEKSLRALATTGGGTSAKLSRRVERHLLKAAHTSTALIRSSLIGVESEVLAAAYYVATRGQRHWALCNRDPPRHLQHM